MCLCPVECVFENVLNKGRQNAFDRDDRMCTYWILLLWYCKDINTHWKCCQRHIASMRFICDVRTMCPCIHVCVYCICKLAIKYGFIESILLLSYTIFQWPIRLKLSAIVRAQWCDQTIFGWWNLWHRSATEENHCHTHGHTCAKELRLNLRCIVRRREIKARMRRWMPVLIYISQMCRHIRFVSAVSSESHTRIIKFAI